MTPPPVPAPDAPPARKKYKYTQQLVGIALDELTQDEIAKLCRVSQSIVSGWKHGQSRAYEHQLVELKRRFGHRLHRATFRVYLALVRPPDPEAADWEPTRRETWMEDQLVDEWVDAPEGGEGLVLAEGEPRLVARQVVRRTERSRAVPDPSGLRVVQVEGPVTLRHVMHRPAPELSRPGRLAREPVARWLVHHLGRGRFALVRQRRRLLSAPELEVVRERLRTVRPIAESWSQAQVFVEAGDDAARWLSWIEAPLSPDDLLARADDAVGAGPVPLGASLLPFLVRKMLVELNYPVPGVERIAAEE